MTTEFVGFVPQRLALRSIADLPFKLVVQILIRSLTLFPFFVFKVPIGGKTNSSWHLFNCPLSPCGGCHCSGDSALERTL